jgi:hypothetical protein
MIVRLAARTDASTHLCQWVTDTDRPYRDSGKADQSEVYKLVQCHGRTMVIGANE